MLFLQPVKIFPKGLASFYGHNHISDNQNMLAGISLVARQSAGKKQIECFLRGYFHHSNAIVPQRI